MAEEWRATGETSNVESGKSAAKEFASEASGLHLLADIDFYGTVRTGGGARRQTGDAGPLRTDPQMPPSVGDRLPSAGSPTPPFSNHQPERWHPDRNYGPGMPAQPKHEIPCIPGNPYIPGDPSRPNQYYNHSPHRPGPGVPEGVPPVLPPHFSVPGRQEGVPPLVPPGDCGERNPGAFDNAVQELLKRKHEQEPSFEEQLGRELEQRIESATSKLVDEINSKEVIPANLKRAFYDQLEKKPVPDKVEDKLYRYLVSSDEGVARLNLLLTLRGSCCQLKLDSDGSGGKQLILIGSGSQVVDFAQII